MAQSVFTCHFIGYTGDFFAEMERGSTSDPEEAHKAGMQRSLDSRYLFDDIIRPVCESDPFQFRSERLRHIGRPQVNLPQTLENLLSADIAIFDLTGSDPNIMYELGLRHMMCRPTVHFIRKGFSPCFDLEHVMPIIFDPDDSTRHENTKRQLATLFHNFMHDPDGGRLRPLNDLYKGNLVVGGVEFQPSLARVLHHFLRQRTVRPVSRPRGNGTTRPFY